jgi:hypothetical protein
VLDFDRTKGFHACSPPCLFDFRILAKLRGRSAMGIPSSFASAEDRKNLNDMANPSEKTGPHPTIIAGNIVQPSRGEV